MVELDYDKVLAELKKFPTNEQNDIPEMLDQFLQKIAKNGEIVYSWDLVKPLFLKKLEIVMDTFSKEHPMLEDQLMPPNCQKFVFEDCKKSILNIFEKFNDPPFTTQRLSEILVDPEKHYRRLDKLMRGIERNVLVISPLPPIQDNYWDDYPKESSYKDLYTNCSLSNSFKAAFEESDDAEPSELINEVETNGENSGVTGSSSSYDNSSYMANTQLGMSNTFYDHHIQQPNTHMLDSIVELHSQGPHHSHTQSSGLAPLQQLDSFTNVFASTTTHLTHLSSSSTTYSLDASMSTSSWSSTHLKGPYEDVIQHSDDPHNDDNENIIVDDEEEEDDEEVVGKISDPTLEENKNFFYQNESQTISDNVSQENQMNELSNELSVNTDLSVDEVPTIKTGCLDAQNAEDDDQLSQENAFKKRLSPTPVTEEVIIETEDTLTPKKIKIAEHSPEESSVQDVPSDVINNVSDEQQIVPEAIEQDPIKDEQINDFNPTIQADTPTQEAMEH